MYPECYFQGTPYIDEDYAVPTQGSVLPYGGGSMIPGTPAMPYSQSTMPGGVPFSQGPIYQTPMQNFQTQMPGQGQMPGAGMGSTDFEMEPGAPIQKDINYTQGYLKTLIGRRVKIEFLIGTDMFIDREGVLQQVGISYVVIREVNTNNLVMCDIYAIKFVNVFETGGSQSGASA